VQFWQGIIQKLFRIFFTTADKATQFVYSLTKGALGHHQAGYNILLLTTTGRKSGKPRTHALLYLQEGKNWVVAGSNGGDKNHPDWYYNLMTQPEAIVQVGKYQTRVKAPTVTDLERNTLWKQLLRVWSAYANYQQGIQREIPIVVLEPVNPPPWQNDGSEMTGQYYAPVVVKSLSVDSDFSRGAMFIPIHRKTIWRDMVVIQLGYALFGLSIAVMIQANLGTGAWAVLEVALSKILHLTPGTLSIIVGFSVLLLALLLGEKIGWGTIANIIFIGPWEDFFLWLIPVIKDKPLIQFGMLLGSILVMGIASAIYIGVDAGAGPRDSLMLAVKRKTGLSVRLARASIELAVVIVGWVLGGPLGIGTVIVAVLIGPAVQWGFKLFHVNPHKNREDPLADVSAAMD
jgi:deazaflavin-dependent oxidoreductase (nitroreductase family)